MVGRHEQQEVTVSRRNKIIAAVVVLAVVAAAAAFAVFGSRGAGPQIETASVTEQELAVTITASGRVERGVSADVYPPGPGVLDSIKVSEGETVTAGQVIAQMDTAPFALQVAQAEAGLAQARAQLAAIDSQTPIQAEIDAARAQVAAADQAYRAAQQQVDTIGSQAPNSGQVAAAQAATRAAQTAYAAASRAYDAAAAMSPNPSLDATVAAAAVARDQAYAGFLGAQAQEQALSGTDLGAARAQAQAGADQSFAALQGARAQLDRLTGTSASAQRSAAQAAVRQAAEALYIAQKALDDATLVAPIDGVVIFNSAAGAAGAAAAAAAGGMSGDDGKPVEGSAVAPQAPPFTVVDLNALKFVAEVDEVDISRITTDMPASVSLDAFPGQTFDTTVLRVNPAAQPTATGGTVFAVDLPLEDAAAGILLGMRGDADIEVSSVGSALTIPIEALFSEGGNDYVYVVEDGRLNRTGITAGATTDTRVEALDGLSAGDRVALSGTTQYSDGMAVRTEGD